MTRHKAASAESQGAALKNMRKFVQAYGSSSKFMMEDVRHRLEPLVVPATRDLLKQYSADDTFTLEVGCGPGQYRLAVLGTYVGLDVTAEPYREELPRIVDVVGTASALPFRDAVFDLVFFSNVFYHFPDPENVIAQSLRVLKPGGMLIIIDYSKASLERLHESYARHGWPMTIRASSDWDRLLQQFGLKNVQIAAHTPSILAKTVNKILPNQIWFKVLDNKEMSIVVKGQKNNEY